jgi:hypothetical protein
MPIYRPKSYINHPAVEVIINLFQTTHQKYLHPDSNGNTPARTKPVMYLF